MTPVEPVPGTYSTFTSVTIQPATGGATGGYLITIVGGRLLPEDLDNGGANTMTADQWAALQAYVRVTIDRKAEDCADSKTATPCVVTSR